MLASLAPGSFTVLVTVTGFKSFGRRDLTLNVGRTTQLDIKLEVGEVSETVTVFPVVKRLPFRVDDINRFRGDLLDGREDHLNPNFGTLLFVTNGVSSSYHGATIEVRRSFADGF